MIVRSALTAVTRTPLRFLRSAWPWRSLGYLLLSLLPQLIVAAVAVAAFNRLHPIIAGPLLLLLILLAAPVIAWFEGWRLRLVDNDPLPARAPIRQRLRSPDAWREAAYTLVAVSALAFIDLGVVTISLGVPGALLTAPLQPDGVEPMPAALLAIAGLVALPLAAYPITAWAGARAAMTRAVLSPPDAEVLQIKQSRARLVDAFELERRRIERDLHDGAQQRLVALSMRLGLLRLEAPADSPLAAGLDEAHEQAKLALAEIRELIHGVHPQVLSGRGLEAAVRDLAGRSPVPITVDVELPRRLPAAVETNAYYIVAEALANIAKHSRAGSGHVRGRLSGDLLLLEIGDDGIGGARPAAVADRVSLVDGHLVVTSPRGGPTLLRMEIPCE